MAHQQPAKAVNGKGPGDAPGQEERSGEPAVGFDDIFSLRRPKDAKAGLSSGLKSIAKGVAGGAAGLFAAPIVGATREGVAGFAKGLASGVVGAVVLPVTGVGVGAVQLVRGIMNQPEALVQQAQGKLWDEERREWVDKHAIVAMEPPKAKANKGHKRPSGGDDYYALLQVPRDATPDQIKKQYYMLARKWHPDKNPGDATAHEKFQKLGEAYQVLGNDELRARYDEHGSEGLDVNFMEGGEFFSMLFGSDSFEHLIGELLIANAAKNAGELTSADMKRDQAVRVARLSVNLKALLVRYTQGDEAGFKLAMEAEAERLVKASFGETMLHTIGKVYEAQADIQAGGFLDGTLARWRANHENMKSQFQAASAAIKVYAAQQKLEAWQRDQDKKVALAAAAAAKAEAEAAAAAAAAAEKADEEAPADPAAPASSGDKASSPSAPVSGAAASTAKAAAAGASAAAAGAPAANHAGPAGGASSSSHAPKGPTIEELMEKARLEEATMPLMLEAMWAANVLDIQSTLRKVCKFVLTEEGVQKPELAARAAGLKQLGQIFQAAQAPESTVAPSSAKQQMEEAMLKVVEKRAQQEAAGTAHDDDD